MPSMRINNFLESRRGLGHMTLTIFGSTVGYPSDSLASCLTYLLTFVGVLNDIIRSPLIMSIWVHVKLFYRIVSYRGNDWVKLSC